MLEVASPSQIVLLEHLVLLLFSVPGVVLGWWVFINEEFEEAGYCLVLSEGARENCGVWFVRAGELCSHMAEGGVNSDCA